MTSYGRRVCCWAVGVALLGVFVLGSVVTFPRYTAYATDYEYFDGEVLRSDGYAVAGSPCADDHGGTAHHAIAALFGPGGTGEDNQVGSAVFPTPPAAVTEVYLYTISPAQEVGSYRIALYCFNSSDALLGTTWFYFDWVDELTGETTTTLAAGEMIDLPADSNNAAWSDLSVVGVVVFSLLVGLAVIGLLVRVVKQSGRALG